MEALALESSTMKNAFEAIDRLSQNPETRRLADFREQELRDILQREEDEKEKGIEQEKRETVISLHSNGMSVENIAKNVRLSTDRVLKIIKSIEH